MKNEQIRCRIEELPFLAEFIRDYFIRDRADFVAFSTLFNDDFLQRFDNQLKQIKELLRPALLIAEMKTITDRIGNHYLAMRSIVNKVERYAEMAKETLNTKPAYFGFKNLRREINVHNDEAVVNMLHGLLQHIDSNSAALEANGLSHSYRQEIEMAINTFETDILAQTRKQDERERRIKENSSQFDTLWNMIAEIVKTGKVIYKAKDKTKLKYYTHSKLIKKVRLTRIKLEEQPEATEPAVGNPA